MANSNEKITLSLDTQKSAAQINADIKKLQNQLKKIQAAGALDNASTVKRINSQILALQSQLKIIHINTDIDTDNVDKAVRQLGEAMDALKELDGSLKTIKYFSAAEKAMDDMADSAGNAEAEISDAMDSIGYKLNEVKESGAGTFQNLFAREDIKPVLGIIDSLSNGLDWLIKKVTLFTTAWIGIGKFLGSGKSRQRFCPLWM